MTKRKSFIKSIGDDAFEYMLLWNKTTNWQLGISVWPFVGGLFFLSSENTINRFIGIVLLVISVITYHVIGLYFDYKQAELFVKMGKKVSKKVKRSSK